MEVSQGIALAGPAGALRFDGFEEGCVFFFFGFKVALLGEEEAVAGGAGWVGAIKSIDSEGDARFERF